MVIDIHCHAGKGDILTAPWNTTAPIEPSFTVTTRCRIEKCAKPLGRFAFRC
jgi:hypothetical protein